MAKTKQMMETDKKGIKRQFFPVTHAGAVLGLKEFLEGDFFQADFDRVMALLEERSDKAFAEIDEKSDAMVKHADEKIAEFDNKIVVTNQTLATLEKEIYDTQQTFENMDVFNKQESSANVIYQIVGKDKVQMSLTLDMKNKLIGSVVENPHWTGAAFVVDSLENPDYFQEEFSQSRYTSVADNDGKLATVTSTRSNMRPAVCFKYNLLEMLKSLLGDDFFIDRGAETNAQKILELDRIVNSFDVGTYSRGQDVDEGVYYCASKLWFDNSRWTGENPRNSTNTIKRLYFEKQSNVSMSKYVDENGIMKVIVYGAISDGINSTSVSVDYCDLNISLGISANEHIKSLVAAYYRENEKYTFEKVGEV